MKYRKVCGGSAGFTLMEVLLVLAILGIIMAMVMPRVLGRQESASIDATKVSIQGLTQALQLYSLDHRGKYPTASDGLSVLLKNPGKSDPMWRGPYLDREPQDAWGNEIHYRSPARRSAEAYDLSSAGPDGIPGNDDDIGNW